MPKPLVGMVHLGPLPGSPRWGGSMAEVIERAVRDASALQQAGLDGALVENYFDAPFYGERAPAETIAAMTRVVAEVAAAVTIPIGVNVLRNDALGALAIAAATAARFIRVNVHTGAMLTDQGWIRGQAERSLRLREQLGLETAILADVQVKHAAPAPGVDLVHAARDCWERGLADVLVVSGTGTGEPTPRTSIERVKTRLAEAPVWVGSGATPDSVRDLLAAADGVIVGSALQAGGAAGGGVQVERARSFVEAARR